MSFFELATDHRVTIREVQRARPLIEISDVPITLFEGVVGPPPCRTGPTTCTQGGGHMLIVTCGGDRCCKLRPSQCAMVAVVYLREHTTPAKIATGFRIS